jgi:TetR/AcrR family transcriptional repressor of nem operon
MGIGRGSLYAAFGSKRALFHEALDRYLDEAERVLLEPLRREGPPRRRIEECLRAASERCRSGSPSCLAVKCAVTIAARDPEALLRVRRFTRRIEDAFHDTLLEAQCRGEVASRLSPRALARFFTHSLHGLAVTAAVDSHSGAARDALRVTLSVLD